MLGSRLQLPRSPLLTAEHPVAFFVNGYGDHLLTLPALRALARLFAGRLTLICMPGARHTFFAELPLRAVYAPLMHKEAGTRTFDAAAVARSVQPCDLLLSLHPWHSSAVDRLLERLAPEHSIGFTSAFQTIVYWQDDRHAVDLAFQIPQWLVPSLQLSDFAGPPVFPREAQEWAAKLRRLAAAPRRILAVHADTLPEKMWPAERLVRVLDAFLERHPEFLAFVVGSYDQGLNRGRHGRRVVPFYGVPLAHSLALVGQADLFLGVDSCMLHAADFYRIPGVGLFAPPPDAEGYSSVAGFGFRFARHRHVCGDGRMESIPEAAVLAALEELAAAEAAAGSSCTLHPGGQFAGTSGIS